MLDNLQELEDKRNEIEGNVDKSKKVFDIKKVNSKKESYQGSSYNVYSEEQKNNPSNGSKNDINQINGSNTDSNVSTRSTMNYILLDKGRVIIKGNEIETIVPCDIETINNKISMISPRYPVKVSINPLSLCQPHVYNPKSQSFTSKESYQSMGQMSNFDVMYTNSAAQSNSSIFNHNISSYQPSFQSNSYLQLLEQSFCIGNCKFLNCSQTPENNSNFDNQDQRMTQSSAKNPENLSQFLSNSTFSFSDRYY